MQTDIQTAGSRVLLPKRRHEVRLKSRGGEGYLLLTVVLLAFVFVIMSVALNGLGLAVTYRRAVGLASVGAQAGAGSLAAFDGQTVSLSGEACQIALATVQASLPAGVNSADVRISCTQGAMDVVVSVSLKPLHVFGGVFPRGIEFVQATSRAAPKYGINDQEN